MLADDLVAVHGQADQQHPAVLVEPLQVAVAPGDDLRQQAVQAHEVLQRAPEPLPLVIGLQVVEPVKSRLQVLVQPGVQPSPIC